MYKLYNLTMTFFRLSYAKTSLYVSIFAYNPWFVLQKKSNWLFTLYKAMILNSTLSLYININFLFSGSEEIGRAGRKEKTGNSCSYENHNQTIHTFNSYIFRFSLYFLSSFKLTWNWVLVNLCLKMSWEAKLSLLQQYW